MIRATGRQAPGWARTLRQSMVGFGPALAALFWVRYELAHVASAASASDGISGPSMQFGPARFFVAYATFVVLAFAVPAFYALDGLLFDRLRGRAQRVLLAFLAAALVPPFGLAGYWRHALDTRVIVAGDGLACSSGGQTARMPWEELRGMRLTLTPDRQRLEVVGNDRVLRTDLRAFLPEDRMVMVRGVAEVANLRLLKRGREEWVWVRSAPIMDPMGR